MIQLTRLRHGEKFFLNPDLFERVDTHVDTVVRLTDGTEYVVSEPGDEIVRKIAEYRARIIAIAGVLQAGALAGDADTAGGHRDRSDIGATHAAGHSTTQTPTQRELNAAHISEEHS